MSVEEKFKAVIKHQQNKLDFVKILLQKQLELKPLVVTFWNMPQPCEHAISAEKHQELMTIALCRVLDVVYKPYGNKTPPNIMEAVNQILKTKILPEVIECHCFMGE